MIPRLNSLVLLARGSEPAAALGVHQQ